MIACLRPALMSLILFTLITGVVYPLVVTGIAQMVFPYQANGSLIVKDGKVTELLVDDRVFNQTLRYVALRLDDGQSIALVGPGLDNLPAGIRAEATGRSAGATLFVTATRLLPGEPRIVTKAANAPAQVEGTLAMVHSDDFEHGRGRFDLTVIGDDTDLRLVNVLATSLLVQATRSLAAAGPQFASNGVSRTRSFRQSFLIAYASRIRERLREAFGAYVDPEVAERVIEVWRERYDAPLQLVGGERWLTGNVSFWAPSRPSIFTNGGLRTSMLDEEACPWTSVADFRKRGGVLVWPIGRDGAALPYELIKHFPDAEVLPPLSLPYETAAALAPQGRNAGSASAMLGTVQFGAGAVVGMLLGALGAGTAVPMAALVAACGLSSLAVYRLAA